MASSEVSISSKDYRGEFKIEAVRQVTDRGIKVAEVAERLGGGRTAYTHGCAGSANLVWSSDLRWIKVPRFDARRSICGGWPRSATS